MSLRSALVPSLLALTPLAAWSAVEISDDVELKVSMRLQTRIEMASASDAAGNDFDIWEPGSVSEDDVNQINMMIRRARLYLKGKYKDDLKFNLTFMADELGANDDKDPTGVDVRYAWIAKEIKNGDLKHTVLFGLNKPWFVSADTDSSSKMLFATNRQTAQYNHGRQVLLSYKVSSPMFTFGVNLSEDEDAAGTGTSTDNNDLEMSFRVETGFSEENTLSKRQESFLGKDGFGHLLGFGFGTRTDNSDVADDDGHDTFVVDYNLHMDQLSLNADLISRSNDDDTDVLSILVQAGWAIPGDDMIIEPALRLALIDNDTDNDDEQTVYTEEGGASGMYIDAGVNLYFDGHNNKLNLGLVSYSPEDGDGDATVFRVQHQLNF